MSAVWALQKALDGIALNTAKTVDNIYKEASYMHYVDEIRMAFEDAYEATASLPQEEDTIPQVDEIDLDTCIERTREKVEALESKILTL